MDMSSALVVHQLPIELGKIISLRKENPSAHNENRWRAVFFY